MIKPDGVASRWMVGVCLCYIPLHHKGQKISSSGTGSPGKGSPRKKAVKCLCVFLPKAEDVFCCSRHQRLVTTTFRHWLQICLLTVVSQKKTVTAIFKHHAVLLLFGCNILQYLTASCSMP